MESAIAGRASVEIVRGSVSTGPPADAPVACSTPSRIPMRRAHRAAPALLLLLTGASCHDDGPCAKPSEVCDVAHARAMVADDSVPVWPTTEAGKPVILYVDRSQSMRGFLDPAYRTRIATDYRAVLDGFDARLRPAQVFGFGNEVRAAEGSGLGLLGNKDFYSDGNTELEEIFPRIEADSTLGSTHVIIGDGRRGDPNAADGQFIAMRAQAERWIAAGGTFIVASSAAPFQPVANDPAGCRASGEASEQTCPLYAFAFVAPGDEGQVAAALAAVFQNLYVTPLPALPERAVGWSAQRSAQITFRSGWTAARDSTPIARVRGSAATNVPLRATLALRDTTSPLGRAALLAIRGRRLVPAVAVRTLVANPAASPWKPSPAKSALMRQADDPFTYEFISRGPSKGIPRYLYRLELHPAGEPSWLDAFDAESAGDALRTYGLGRLFEGFEARDPLATPPVIRSFVVVN